MSLLKAEGLRAYYNSPIGQVKAVEDISLSVEEDDFIGIAGESGCGKSTLANVLMMNIRPPLKLYGGRLFLNGEEISDKSRDYVKEKFWGTVISIVPQAALNSLMPTKRTKEFIIDVVQAHKKISEKEIIEMAKNKFIELGLSPSVLDLYPHELSGGMRQRVIIVASTILNPKVLIADEPTSALDVSTQKQVLKMMLDLQRKQSIRSTILITHDIAIQRQVCNKLIVMYAGRIVEYGNVDDVLYNPKHPYTKGLINSVLTPEPEVRRRGLMALFIPGEPPNLVNPPPGCSFHPRCPFAMPRCKSETPGLTYSGDRAVACWLYIL
ncbi:MAG: ABC transporter ATP-binding protein [Thermoproteota archaeon]